MRRRDVIKLLGGAAMSANGWPLPARAQPAAIPLIGFLNPNPAARSAHYVTSFRQGLGETGYVEGRNVAIDYRWADDHNDRLAGLATDLVQRRPALIVAASGDSAPLAVKAATTTIPILFISASDPVQIGLAASLARPGANLTGVSRMGAELMPKRMEILCEVAPNALVVDLLVNPQGAITAAATKDVEAAARTLGRKLRVHSASDERELEDSFQELTRLRSSALLIMADSFFRSRSAEIGALSLRYAIPAMFSSPEFTAGGGLVNYESSLTDSFRLIGNYAGRILKGDKPSELPVQQPTRFELVVNLKTARALGITVPLPLLARADEVIE
jgi:putative tryptophan/tyrosine transport system substrate-binding protein